MRRRRLGHIDLDTKEVFEEGTLAYFPLKRQNGFVEGWFAMALAAFKVLKMFTHAHDLRVMMALFEKVGYENKIHVCQADLAKDLGMQRSNVSSAIKRLVEAGVIVKGPKDGINCTYQLNPNFGWRGDTKNHVEVLDGYRERKMKETSPPDKKDTNQE